MTEHPTWRKSSFTSGQGGGNSCVELAYAGLVRDSKHPGPVLRVDFRPLVEAVKREEI
jgi:hypothetical protein